MWGLAGGPAKHVKHAEQTLYANWKAHKGATHDVSEGGTGACDVYAPRGCKSYSWFSPNPNKLGLGRIDCAWNRKGKALKNVGQCYAQTGFDGVAGVGTPKGLKLFK
jgi:hypothetical protein